MAAASRDTHKKARQKLRKRLAAEGVPPAQIARQVEQLRARQAAARRADVPLGDLDRVHDETWAELRLDDRGYRPTTPDALLRGAARVTPATARAARRRKATTRYEHDLQETSR